MLSFLATHWWWSWWCIIVQFDRIGYINFHPCIVDMHKQNTHILFFTQAHSVMIWPENWKQDFIHWAWNCFHRAWKVNCFNLKNISGNWRKYKVGLVEQRLVWPRLQVFTLFTILSLAPKIACFFAEFTIYDLGTSK